MSRRSRNRLSRSGAIDTAQWLGPLVVTFLLGSFPWYTHAASPSITGTVEESAPTNVGDVPAFTFRPNGPILPAPADLQPTLVVLTVNSRNIGDMFVLLDPRGHVFLPVDDLKRLGAAVVAGLAYRHGEEVIVDLASLEKATFTFHRARLAVELMLDAGDFALQKSATKDDYPAASLTETLPNLFMNYGINSLYASGVKPAFNFTFDAGAASGPWLLRNAGEFQYQQGLGRRYRRFNTTLTRDLPDTLQRFEVGDVTGLGSAFSGAQPLGGVSFRRAYDTNPAYYRFPSASADGTTQLPAQVTVYSDGVPIYRKQLDPGPFHIANLENVGGQRDMEIVVRQIDGKEQRFQYKFFFSDLALKAGEHDYAYALGRIRTIDDFQHVDYGRNAAMFYHRYGLNDWVSIGASGESTTENTVASANTTLRLDRFGVISLALARSGLTGHAGSGSGTSLAYNFVRGPFNLGFNHQRLTSAFTPLQSTPGADSVLRASRLSLGYGIGAAGTLNLFAGRSCHADGQCEHTESAAWQGTLARLAAGAIQLSARFQRGSMTGNTWTIAVSYQAPSEFAATATTGVASGDTRLQSVELVRPVPFAEGVGIDLRLDRAIVGDQRTRSATSDMVWKLASATLGVHATQQRSADHNSQQSSLSLSGGVALFDGRLHFSRANADANVVVEIEPALAGIRVYRNGTLAGATNAAGRLSITDISSYIETEISISANDLPPQYTLSTLRKKIRATPRSVSAVKFSLTRYYAITGILVRRIDGKLVPLDNVQLEIGAAGNAMGTSLVADGQFYIEGLSPGTFPARIIDAKSRCAFSITLPETEEPVVDLKEVIGCDG